MKLDPRIQYSTNEHRWFRIGLALTVALGFVSRPIRATDQPFPKGIAQFVDLTFLANDVVAWSLCGIAILAALVYASGRRPVATLGVVFAVSVAIFTFSQSNIEKVRHDTNVIPLAILGLLCGHLHWGFVARSRDPREYFGGRSRDDLAVYYALQWIVAMYVLSGITKLIRTDGDWISDSYLVAMQVVRAKHNEYYTELAPAGALEFWLGVARWMIEHPALSRLLCGSILVLELGAFVALCGRAWSLVVGLALIAFHVSVLALMNINFYLNIAILLIYLVNVPHWMNRLRHTPTLADATT